METKAISVRTMTLLKSWAESEQTEVVVIGQRGSYTESHFPSCKVLLPDGTVLSVPMSTLDDYASSKAAVARGTVTKLPMDLKVLAANLQTEQQVTHALETGIVSVSKWQTDSPAYRTSGGKMNRYEYKTPNQARAERQAARIRFKPDNG